MYSGKEHYLSPTYGAIYFGVEDVSKLGNALLVVNVGEVVWTAKTNDCHSERDDSEHVWGMANTEIGAELYTVSGLDVLGDV